MQADPKFTILEFDGGRDVPGQSDDGQGQVAAGEGHHVQGDALFLQYLEGDDTGRSSADGPHGLVGQYLVHELGWWRLVVVRLGGGAVHPGDRQAQVAHAAGAAELAAAADRLDARRHREERLEMVMRCMRILKRVLCLFSFM